MGELTPEMIDNTMKFSDYCEKLDNAMEILSFVGIIGGEKLYILTNGRPRNSEIAKERQEKVTNCLIDLFTKSEAKDE